MKRIDLHTHSVASKDGGLGMHHYRKMLDSRILDAIAVTDHDSVELSLQLHAELGNQIIVGEEISTTEGDLIGLFLSRIVLSGRSAVETAQDIHNQGGLVYVPHPFDSFRSSTGPQLLERLRGSIDIVETYNGRVLRTGLNSKAAVWAADNNLPGAASSDAHGWRGWGQSFTEIDAMPTAENLASLLYKARYHTRRPSLSAKMYPQYHRIRHRLHHA